jgi:hypothetical protein
MPTSVGVAALFLLTAAAQTSLHMLSGHGLHGCLIGKAHSHQRVMRAIQKAVSFLKTIQKPEGTWAPLWFGNQDTDSEENDTWGTARVILALRDLQRHGHSFPASLLTNAEEALVALQQPDGGWSGGRGHALTSSVEETGVALEALAGTGHLNCVTRGVQWLLERIENRNLDQKLTHWFLFRQTLVPREALSSTHHGCGSGAVLHTLPDAAAEAAPEAVRTAAVNHRAQKTTSSFRSCRT